MDKMNPEINKAIKVVQKQYKHEKKEVAELTTPVANVLKKNIPTLTEKIGKDNQNWVGFNDVLKNIDRNMTRLKNNELKGNAYSGLLKTISISPKDDEISMPKLIEKASGRFGFGQQKTLISVCELTIDIVSTVLKGIEEISNIEAQDTLVN